MDLFEEKYLDIISGLNRLRVVKADDSLRHRIQKALPHQSMKESPSFLFLSPVRIALSLLIMFFFAGGTITAAASKPGEALYPLKKTATTLLQSFAPKKKDNKPQESQTPPQPTQLPSPTSAKETTTPTQVPSLTPTKKPQAQIPNPPGLSVQATTETNKGQGVAASLGVGVTTHQATNQSQAQEKQVKNDEKTDNSTHENTLPIPVHAEIKLGEKALVKLTL